MADKQLVTVREVAEAFDLGYEASAAVEESLRRDGVTILTNWAGRPAITMADATRIVAKHHKEQAEWRERNDAENTLNHEANEAQQEFDRICGVILPELRHENPHWLNPQQQGMLMAAARTHAWQEIQGKFSDEALAKVMIKPIVTIEPTDVPAFKVYEVPADVFEEPDKVPDRGLKGRAAALLGMRG